MFVDRNESPIKHQMPRLRTAIYQLFPKDVDLQEFYKNNLCKKASGGPLSEKAIITRHCINWLYTKRCETQLFGKEFIEFLLWVLRESLHYVDEEDIRTEFILYLIDVCFNIRRKHLY